MKKTFSNQNFFSSLPPSRFHPSENNFNCCDNERARDKKFINL
jgi:hypothetical protein